MDEVSNFNDRFIGKSYYIENAVPLSKDFVPPLCPWVFLVDLMDQNEWSIYSLHFSGGENPRTERRTGSPIEK